MRVLLVSANRMRHPYPVHPIGLDYVAAALEPAHQVRILDLCPLEEGEVGPALAAAVREHAPGAVGLSLRNVEAGWWRRRGGWWRRCARSPARR